LRPPASRDNPQPLRCLHGGRFRRSSRDLAKSVMTRLGSLVMMGSGEWPPRERRSSRCALSWSGWRRRHVGEAQHLAARGGSLRGDHGSKFLSCPAQRTADIRHFTRTFGDKHGLDCLDMTIPLAPVRRIGPHAAVLPEGTARASTTRDRLTLGPLLPVVRRRPVNATAASNPLLTAA
jgi:hypothetical protein